MLKDNRYQTVVTAMYRDGEKSQAAKLLGRRLWKYQVR